MFRQILTQISGTCIYSALDGMGAMADQRSRQKLLEFLDYLAEKGLIAKGTASARKAAAGKVLGILSDDEARDVTKLDLDEVMGRFTNLEGKAYTPGSLSTYLSRIKSAVDDFNTYLQNPLGFKPSVQNREKRKPDTKKDTQADTRVQRSVNDQAAKVSTPLSSSILPIPIRSDLTVFVQGLPFNLTEAEATKIANVIRAMATPS
jgi:hypothetical protein